MTSDHPLLGTGIGGLMASMVGGASVITFPVLLAVGLPPVVATASNLVAVSPGNFLAALTDRGNLPPFNRAFVGLVVASVLGALLGAVLLLAHAGAAVRIPDPAAARLCHRAVRLCRPITQWLRARASARGRAMRTSSVTSIPMLLPISIYGGYFGAGVGVLLLGVLSIATGGDYRSANVAKNLVSSLNTLAAAVWFIANGAVSWPQTLVMMVGCLIGGYLRRAPGAHRPAGGRCAVVIVVVGAVLTAAVRVALSGSRYGCASVHQPLASSRCSGRVSGSQIVKWFMPGDRLVARLDALLAPVVGDDLALPQELRRFLAADHGVEHAAAHRPARTAARCARASAASSLKSALVARCSSGARSNRPEIA